MFDTPLCDKVSLDTEAAYAKLDIILRAPITLHALPFRSSSYDNDILIAVGDTPIKLQRTAAGLVCALNICALLLLHDSWKLYHSYSANDIISFCWRLVFALLTYASTAWICCALICHAFVHEYFCVNITNQFAVDINHCNVYTSKNWRRVRKHFIARITLSNPVGRNGFVRKSAFHSVVRTGTNRITLDYNIGIMKLWLISIRFRLLQCWAAPPIAHSRHPLLT